MLIKNRKIFNCLLMFYGFFLFFNISNAQIQKKITLTGSIYAEYCSDVCHPPATAEFEMHNAAGKTIYIGKVLNKENGVYRIPDLDAGETYYFIVTDTNFLKMVFTIVIPYTDKYPELSRDFLIAPKKSGAEMIFDVSPFKFHSARLKEGYNTFNDRVLEVLHQNPDINFEISCFPYMDENKQENINLTQERCSVLREFFISKGIQSGRLTIRPNGETDPMNPPPDSRQPKGRRYNGSTYIVIK